MSNVDRMFADNTETLPAEVVVPAQFFRPARGAKGERALMAAVLEDAMRVYHRHSARQFMRTPRVLREVQRWFASRSKAELFSFERICEELDIDPTYIRQQLARIPQPYVASMVANRDQRRLPVRRVA